MIIISAVFIITINGFNVLITIEINIIIVSDSVIPIINIMFSVMS